MFGWFKKKPQQPKIKCVVCGEERDMDTVNTTCKDGPLCDWCFPGGYTIAQMNGMTAKQIKAINDRTQLEQNERYARESELWQSGKKVNAQAIDGLSGVTNGTITALDNHLEICGCGSKATLPYNRVLDAAIKSECITTADTASPALRALGGGILFGSVGAIAGAASGLTAKKLTVIHSMELTYRGKNGKANVITLLSRMPTPCKPNDRYNAIQYGGGNPFLRVSAAINHKRPQKQQLAHIEL